MGEFPGTKVFVPEVAIRPNETYSEDAYLDSGWASKNMADNPGAIGSHIFPKIPLVEVAPPTPDK